MTPSAALTIAGSDSGGGAGMQADLRTFAALGVHGCTAVAALTAQNTVEVRDVLVTPAPFLRIQIETVLDDIVVAATKTGMLATADNVSVVAELAALGRLPNLVVDPVMVSSTGARLLDREAERSYIADLIPNALVATPNCREAAVLLGWDEIATRDRQRDAARALVDLGVTYAVVKGGDLVDSGGESVDVVASAAGLNELHAPRIDTMNNHGTGCSFAAAVTGFLALGHDPEDSIDRAKSFVHLAIDGAKTWKIGHGHGPVDHFATRTREGEP
ncbi:MAG: bifunctional hydroxymethylpyrimidine kinase/phosphomethylpyrimidine kinase [Acidimicrobiales bacterium]|nr:bifunctional hydroxymethylpyrimidine kinase/phosphomethylpyrimidine kinase [Acidimicrobiales bacterium]